VTRRPILVLAGMALVLAGLAVAATLRFIIPQVDLIEFDYSEPVDQEAIDAYYEWAFSGAVYLLQVPWLVTASVLSGVAALALAAYRAQRRIQDAGRRTVSAPASTSVRNPVTTPKSSPSSSNSSARASRTSNVDAFR
jgi:hypothetical protein